MHIYGSNGPTKDTFKFGFIVLERIFQSTFEALIGHDNWFKKGSFKICLKFLEILLLKKRTFIARRVHYEIFVKN